MEQPSTDKPRLGALDARSQTTRAPARQAAYSNIVKKLRWALPVAALSILAALMIWPKIQIEISERRFSMVPVDKAAMQQAATQNTLVNANFSSIDSKGRPFSIISTEAVQQNNTPDIITLKNPKGTLTQKNNETLTAQALQGIYAQEKQHLTLKQNVVLTRSDGTVMHTQALFIDLMANESRTAEPVSISGPQGTLDAQGMVISNGGAVSIFRGPAKLVLNSKSSINPTERAKGKP